MLLVLASTRAFCAALSSALIPAFSIFCWLTVVVVTGAGNPVSVPPAQVVVVEFPQESLLGMDAMSDVKLELFDANAQPLERPSEVPMVEFALPYSELSFGAG